VTLEIGDRVKLRRLDRRLEPVETGHPVPIALGPGQTGVVVRFIRRTAPKYLSSLEFPMAVVRWDAQKWAELKHIADQMASGKSYGADELHRMNEPGAPTIPLPPLEFATHPDRL
jgi:hypothetical protein